VNPTVQPTVESTVGPTVRPTVRSILMPCKCAITLVGKLPVITGKTAVLSADAGFLVKYVYDVIVKEVHVRYLIS